MGRNDAKCHQLAILGKGQGCLNAGLERLNILDQMVGSENQQDRVLGFATGLQGCQSNSGCRITADRFQ
ncbi:hypothetical protein D3C76_1811050 [compost metagenome]